VARRAIQASPRLLLPIWRIEYCLQGLDPILLISKLVEVVPKDSMVSVQYLDWWE